MVWHIRVSSSLLQIIEKTDASPAIDARTCNLYKSMKCIQSLQCWLTYNQLDMIATILALKELFIDLECVAVTLTENLCFGTLLIEYNTCHTSLNF